MTRLVYNLVGILIPLGVILAVIALYRWVIGAPVTIGSLVQIGALVVVLGMPGFIVSWWERGRRETHRTRRTDLVARIFLLVMVVPGALALVWATVTALMTGEISPILLSLPALDWDVNPLGFAATIIAQILLFLFSLLIIYVNWVEIRRYFAQRGDAIRS